MKKIIKNFLFKKRFKILKNKKGFSLLEVMIAVGIIGVVAGAGMPVYKGYMKNARRATSQSTLSQLYRVGNLLLTEIDASSTTFTVSAINEKMKGEITAKGSHYKDEDTWCIDIEPTNESPKGCVDADNNITLDPAHVGGTSKGATLKKESLCKLYGGTWSATCGATLVDKKDCKTAGTNEGKCAA